MCLTSDEFLDRYTNISLEEYPPFPIIKLRMKEDGSCPFVKPYGCSIYEDRPSACRLYPLARASMLVGHDKRDSFFIVKEEHCLGYEEDKIWKIDEWLRHEGIYHYDRFNIPWFEIITSYNGAAHISEDQFFKRIQAFYMASYDLDRFKRLIFNSGFFEMYRIPPSVKRKVGQDDTSLLKLSFEWLRFVLYGKVGDSIRPKSMGTALA